MRWVGCAARLRPVRTINCPKCATPVNIPVDEADTRGRVRLVCGTCGARVLIKVNPRALKLSPDIPVTVTNPGLVPFDREYSGYWAVVVHELDTAQQGALRRSLLSMPRFRSNPNKLHDATGSLPYIFHGLKRTEALFLGEELDRLSGVSEAGAQEWLLDENMRLRSRETRGPRPRSMDDDSDIEVLSAVPSSSWEVQFDGGRPSRTDLRPHEHLAPAGGRYGTQPSLSPVGRLQQQQDAALSAEEMGAPTNPPTGTPRPPTTPDPRLFQSFPGDLAEEPSRRSVPSFADPQSLGGADLTAIAAEATRIAKLSNPEAEPVDVPTEPDSIEIDGLFHDAAQGEFEDYQDDDFAIVSINELPGRKFHIGTLHTTISVSANELEVGPQMSIDVALDRAHAVLQQKAQELGGTGIVGLRVTQSAIPTKTGWMLVFVVSGTAVA